MRWDKELYVKIYVRDTPEFLAMSWQARTLLLELIRKVDRRGVMQVGKLGVRGIAIAIQAPVEEIATPIAELIQEGRLVWNEKEGTFVIPNHVDAQEAPQCDALRKRRQRGRRPDEATEEVGGGSPASLRPDSGVTESQGVTSGHAESRSSDSAVTASRAVTPSHAGSRGPDSATDAAALTDRHGEAAVGGDVAKESRPLTRAEGPSQEEGASHEQPDAVTPSHARSRAVTPSHDQIRSDQIRSDQIRSDERESACADARATHAPIHPERKLSDEGRAYAQSVAVTDVDRVFRDFKNHYLAEAKVSADWEALWRRWCDRELRIQRQERDRARPKAPMQLDPPGATRGWTMPEIIRVPKGKPS